MVTNLGEYLRESAARLPDDVALVETRAPGARRELTWAAFDEAADRVAGGLSARGLKAGQRVAIVMANRIDVAIAYVGVLRGGMVAVPVNPRSTTREISRMLGDSGARVVLSDEVGVERVRACGDVLEDLLVVVDGAEPAAGETAFGDFLAAASGSRPVAPPDPEALAVLLYTSGTSGRPRAAMLSHRALTANVEQVAELDPPVMTSDDVVLLLLPLFHVYGLNAVLGQALRQGARVVLVDGFDPDALLDLIRDEGVTNVPVAPPVIAAWAGRAGAREALAGVERILCGASALDPDLAAEFTATTGKVVEQGYGLTETSPVITTTLASGHVDGRPKASSVGRPLPGIELRCWDPSGRDAESTDPAEVWVRGENLFSGYWPDGVDGPRDDGWYPTGDLGILDDDGDLTLVDRLRELVIVSGFNVYPVEVEVVVAEVEGVAEVAVVGVPDERTGEAVVAFVVPKDGATDLEARVGERCAAVLARFKQPRVVVVEGLPHSATGKVAKGRLRALARSSLLDLDARDES